VWKKFRKTKLTIGTHSEKLMKLDAKRREYDIIVIGEESHLAYNRVGLTSFFQHRKVENLYLNPREWVRTTLKCRLRILDSGLTIAV
jgi:NAD(P)H-nitrite reductase large subunit